MKFCSRFLLGSGVSPETSKSRVSCGSLFLFIDRQQRKPVRVLYGVSCKTGNTRNKEWLRTVISRRPTSTYCNYNVYRVKTAFRAWNKAPQTVTIAHHGTMPDNNTRRRRRDTVKFSAHVEGLKIKAACTQTMSRTRLNCTLMRLCELSALFWHPNS